MSSSELEEFSLGYLCTKIGSGVTPRGGENVYKDDGISLIRSQNIYDYVFEYSGLVFIDAEQAEKMKNVEVLYGDILLNITGDSVARCCTVPERVLPARVNQHVSIIRPNSTLLNSRYLLYWINNYPTKELLLSLASTGGTRKALTKSMIENLRLIIPTILEQKAIALTLASLDDKIELNNRICITLEEMAQTIFKSWFVDYWPFQDSDFEDSELGRIPKGWRIGALGEYCDVQKGLSYKGMHLVDSGIPMINLGNVQPGGEFRYDKMKYYDGEYKERHIVNCGDIIIANTDMTADRAILGSPIFVPEITNGDIIFTHHLFAFRNIIIPKTFLYYYLKTNTFRERAESYANGTTVLAISKEDVLSIKLVIPKDEILTKYDELIKSVVELKEEYVKEIHYLETIRDSLLPKLMSGEIPIP